MAISILIAVFMVSGVTLGIMLMIVNYIEVVDQRRSFDKWQKEYKSQKLSG